ncbi:hypothetical protein C7212DRAFT_364362 [Tuber magnatum]|uniref:Uncharacterized protein n=1 Tax=Tuber magnatum TaxID=42249 RepID=A0A317SWT1_9PEZI|nr:hypothetical protein C7212DRAFT_364362 [Tuber magnatum]
MAQEQSDLEHMEGSLAVIAQILPRVGQKPGNNEEHPLLWKALSKSLHIWVLEGRGAPPEDIAQRFANIHRRFDVVDYNAIARFTNDPQTNKPIPLKTQRGKEIQDFPGSLRNIGRVLRRLIRGALPPLGQQQTLSSLSIFFRRSPSLESSYKHLIIPRLLPGANTVMRMLHRAPWGSVTSDNALGTSMHGPRFLFSYCTRA